MRLSWHVWYKDPKTNARRWCGQFYDDKAAIEWKKSQDNPANYVVNNIGPTDFSKTAPAPARPAKPSYDSPAIRRRREEQAELTRRSRERLAAQRAQTEADRAAMAGVRKDAQVALDKHRKDEAADLKNGKAV